MTHVCRKFFDAEESHPELAAQVLDYITLLYELEANLWAEEAAPYTMTFKRQTKAKSITDAMEEWMKAVSKQCTLSDLIGQALDYAYKLWP